MTAADQRYVSRAEANRYEPRPSSPQSLSATASTALLLRAKAELVRWGERADDLPAKAWARHKHELCAVWFGAKALRKDWLWWVKNRAAHAEIDEQVRLARTQGMMPARMMKDRSDADTKAGQRFHKSLLVLATAALAVLVASVASYRWTTTGELAAAGGLGVAGTLLMLAGGKYYRREWVMRLSPLPLPVVAFAGIESLRWWPAMVAVLLALVVCEHRGVRLATNAPTRAEQSKGLKRRDWISMWETVETVLVARGKGLTRNDALPLAVDGSEVGVDFGLRSTEPILSEDVRALEREFGWPAGASSWVGDPQAAGSGRLRLLWADPLPPRAHPRREPMSCSYERPFSVAFREGGRTTPLNLNRTRVLLAGDSGSGKSEALQVILDAVCDMPDATWSAIDLQDGPTFPPYARQWNCTGVYTDLESATAHVRKLRAWCKGRNRQLKAGMDYDEDGVVDAWWIVSDEPGRRGHVLFVDELSSATVDKGFASELTLLLEVIRKASGSAVLATPDLDKDRVPRAVIDQTNVQMGFACPFSDSQQLFGKGSTQSGWEPYELTPSSGDDDNDAGKCFIRGGGLNLPEVHRFGRMDKFERRDRNKLRRLWRERFVPEVAVSDEVYAVEVPEPLATLERLSVDGDVHTATVLEALPDGWTAQSLAAALKPHGVAAGNVVVQGVQRKGFKADQVKRAVAALDG